MYVELHNHDILGDLIYFTENNRLQKNSENYEYFALNSKKIFKNKEKIFVKNVKIHSINTYTDLKNIENFSKNSFPKFDVTISFINEYKEYFYNPIQLITNNIVFNNERNAFEWTLIYSMPYIEKVHNLVHQDFVETENEIKKLNSLDRLNFYSKLFNFCQNCITFTKTQYNFLDDKHKKDVKNGLIFGHQDLNWSNVFYQNDQIKFIDLDSFNFIGINKMFDEISNLYNDR